ncbi:MAG: AbrB/MazE/SpoVT family DNA-binding domain-containing protein [Rhodospirillales bacterium]|nr:AbrB/MazE/SpoVT family DNA-binding domain-containing protein [Rhodospirillales bacterium]
MQMHITRWGNSLGVRIPKDLARQLGMTEGTVVDVTVEGDRLVLKTASPGYSLDQLLEGMTPDAMHQALDWGGWDDDVGREDVS